MHFCENTLREKRPNTEFFMVFILQNTGKYRPEKTPYFHAVLISSLFLEKYTIIEV